MQLLQYFIYSSNMERFFPHNLPENKTQVDLMQRKAKEMNVWFEALAPHWIDLYSDKFREAWDKWVRDLDALEEFLYDAPWDLQSNYKNVVAALILTNPK